MKTQDTENENWQQSTPTDSETDDAYSLVRDSNDPDAAASILVFKSQSSEEIDSYINMATLS
jgi:hypothetical protein